MDKTWLYHYDLETKQQSMEWRHSCSHRPKKFQVPKSNGKFLTSIFWDQDSILLVDYLLKGQTINAEYYSSLLLQLKDILKEKNCGKVNGGWGLSCTCMTVPRLTRHLQPRRNFPTWASHCLAHPPSSPDLALSDYHLFPGLKKQLKGRHFSSDTEVIATAETWLDRQPSEFFFWVACKS